MQLPQLLLLLPQLLLLLATRAAASDNVCGTGCCPGWRRAGDGRCSEPVCDGDCGERGQCVSANLCYCPDGQVRYSCGLAAGARPGGRCRCYNGGVCVRGRCRCRSGFAGRRCQLVTCPNYCSGRGRCQSDGRCLCDRGFGGSACDVTVKGPCFAELRNGTCGARLTGAYTTRESCCNSFGAAWGHDCGACTRSPCGFARLTFGSSCVPLDFCKIPGVCGAGSCVIEGRYDFRCSCPSGQRFNRRLRVCEIREDYCQRHLGACGVGGACTSRGASYTCTCYSGYRLRADGKFCAEDPCLPAHLCQHGRCQAQADGGYSCRCNAGYEPGSDERSCVRRTYCSLNPRACGNGTCVPVDDFFYCRCHAGYSASPSGLECRQDTTTTTSTTSTTTTTTTTATTTPPAAASSESAVALCRRRRLCRFGQCRPAPAGGFRCQCPPGFRLRLGAAACEPEPLAADAPPADVCDGACANGRCERLNGSNYRCHCAGGYSPSPDGRSCRQLRYCDNFRSTCANGRCVSLSADDFYCDCDKGYEPADDRRSCRPAAANLTLGHLDPCRAFDVCRNGICQRVGANGFRCLCNTGHKLSANRQQCELAAACDRRPGTCANGRCVNLPDDGAYRCECDTGYRPAGDARSCVQASVATGAGFRPPADPLQRLFHKTYCQKFAYVCGHGACLDLSGSHSFTCACSHGYRLAADRRHCVRVGATLFGACAANPLACGGAGHCVNSDTSDFTCFCYPGFRHAGTDRKSCVPYDYNADTNRVIIHGVDPSVRRRQRQRPSGTSRPPLFFAGSFHISRPGQRRYASLRRPLTACSRMPRGTCANGVCVDTTDGHRCLCNVGYKAVDTGTACVDIDECRVAGDRLCLLGQCVNTIGSYRCLCRLGFRFDAGNRMCVDVDECEQAAGTCSNGRCVNTWGSYECRCDAGYRQSDDRRSCVTDEARIQFSGSMQVHDSRCPDCVTGCWSSRPDLCLCATHEKSIDGILCVPEPAHDVRLDGRAGRLRLLLPNAQPIGAVRSVSRRLRLRDCARTHAYAGYGVLRCRLQAS